MLPYNTYLMTIYINQPTHPFTRWNYNTVYGHRILQCLFNDNRLTNQHIHSRDEITIQCTATEYYIHSSTFSNKRMVNVKMKKKKDYFSFLMMMTRWSTSNAPDTNSGLIPEVATSINYIPILHCWLRPKLKVWSWHDLCYESILNDAVSMIYV